MIPTWAWCQDLLTQSPDWILIVLQSFSESSVASGLKKYVNLTTARSTSKFTCTNVEGVLWPVINSCSQTASNRSSVACFHLAGCTHHNHNRWVTVVFFIDENVLLLFSRFPNSHLMQLAPFGIFLWELASFGVFL